MILADKILALRKSSDLSQEELAEKLNVSRQSVSKWEGAASIPDIDKIIEMSKLFGVSTDYLLKDDIEQTVYSNGTSDDGTRKLTLEEANAFVTERTAYMKKIATGVMLCILSPIFLIILPVMLAPTGAEAIGTGAGTVILLLLVAAAVAMFIMSSGMMRKYKFIERGEFELSYGVSGALNEKSSECETRRTALLTVGVVLCILSPVPLIVSALAKGSDMTAIAFTALLLAIVAFAVYLIITAVAPKSAYDMLLREGDYDAAEVKNNERSGKLGGIYWPIVTAGYLAWSFISGCWDMTWIVWPVAGVLFGAIAVMIKTVKK